MYPKPWMPPFRPSTSVTDSLQFSSNSNSPTPYHAWNDPRGVTEEQRQNMSVKSPYLMTFKNPSNPYFDLDIPKINPNNPRKRKRDQLLQRAVTEGMFEFEQSQAFHRDVVMGDGSHSNSSSKELEREAGKPTCVDVVDSSDEEVNRVRASVDIGSYGQLPVHQPDPMSIPISLFGDESGILGIPDPLIGSLAIDKGDDNVQVSSADNLSLVFLDSDG